MHSLNDLVSSGKVNCLGISDAPVWVVTKANHSAHDHGLRHFVVYQEMWNAAMRDFKRDMVFNSAGNPKFKWMEAPISIILR
ncbi:hypothetical protein BJY01DRAFT_117216 [Aspergillus pseudoustus]|uniref:NADP-dependent oxidoreductase domain-containing protein n=1 Tax=Aspergillus pseudoustus TaxID=1810923 RepID=A0ABR4KHL3_9EURO